MGFQVGPDILTIDWCHPRPSFTNDVDGDGALTRASPKDEISVDVCGDLVPNLINEQGQAMQHIELES